MDITPVPANSNASALCLVMHDHHVPSYVLCWVMKCKPMITKCWTCCFEGFDFSFSFQAFGWSSYSEWLGAKEKAGVWLYVGLLVWKFTGLVSLTSCESFVNWSTESCTTEVASWRNGEVLYFPFPPTCFCNLICQPVIETYREMIGDEWPFYTVS